MLLSELIQQPDVNLVCVQSDTAYEALLLIHECVKKQDAEHGKELHWLCYDLCASNLRQELQIADNDQRYHFHEYFPTSCFNEKSVKTNAPELCRILREKINVTSKRFIVVVDSISALTNEYDPFTMNSVLHEICSSRWNKRSSMTQLFIVIHGKAMLNGAIVLKHLKYLANAWLTVANNKVSALRKKSNGKLMEQMYEFNGNSNFALVKEMNVSQNKIEKIVDGNLTSFRLDLSDQEKEARNAVQLPYTKHLDRIQRNEVSGMKIHYHPDAHDDWDDEEPDNDLEFTQG